MTDSLFIREPENLNGFVPTFTREQVQMGLNVTTYKIGGGLGWMDDEPLKTGYRHSITVAGHTIDGKKDDYLCVDNLELAAIIANEFLADKTNEQRHPEAWKWLRENAKELNISLWYWRAQRRVSEIQAAEREIAELQRKVKIGKIWASIDAVEVKRGEKLTPEERELLYAEFSGEERQKDV